MFECTLLFCHTGTEGRFSKEYELCNRITGGGNSEERRRAKDSTKTSGMRRSYLTSVTIVGPNFSDDL